MCILLMFQFEFPECGGCAHLKSINAEQVDWALDEVGVELPGVVLCGDVEGIVGVSHGAVAAQQLAGIHASLPGETPLQPRDHGAHV